MIHINALKRERGYSSMEYGKDHLFPRWCIWPFLLLPLYLADGGYNDSYMMEIYEGSLHCGLLHSGVCYRA